MAQPLRIESLNPRDGFLSCSVAVLLAAWPRCWLSSNCLKDLKNFHVNRPLYNALPPEKQSLRSIKLGKLQLSRDDPTKKSAKVNSRY